MSKVLVHAAASDRGGVTPPQCCHLKTLDVTMLPARFCVDVALEYGCISAVWYLGEGSLIRLGLGMHWIRGTACVLDNVQSGCRLIAWWLC